MHLFKTTVIILSVLLISAAEARQKTESRRSIPSSVVNYCREVASAGGDYSHVVFEGCIEMETDAKRRLGR